MKETKGCPNLPLLSLGTVFCQESRADCRRKVELRRVHTTRFGQIIYLGPHLAFCFESKNDFRGALMETTHQGQDIPDMRKKRTIVNLILSLMHDSSLAQEVKGPPSFGLIIF